MDDEYRIIDDDPRFDPNAPRPSVGLMEMFITKDRQIAIVINNPQHKVELAMPVPVAKKFVGDMSEIIRYIEGTRRE